MTPSSDETNPCTPVDGPQCPDVGSCDGDCQRPIRLVPWESLKQMGTMEAYRERVRRQDEACATDPDGAPDPLFERKLVVETESRSAWEDELKYRRGR